MVVKRYRLMSADFDARAAPLNTEVDDTWDPEIQVQSLQNQRLVRAELLHEYGVRDYEQKIADFRILGNAPLALTTGT